MRKYEAAELPLDTSNLALAFALYLAGIPFSDESSPVVNIYDAGVLRSLGYEGQGIETAALDAYNSGKPGMLRFGFYRSLEIGEALKAFDDRQRALKRDNRPAAVFVREDIERLTAGFITQTEAIAAAACVIVKRWREELAEWKLHRSFRIERNKHKTRDAEGCEAMKRALMVGDFYLLAAVVMDARQPFLDLWKRFPPMIQIRKKGSSRREGDITIVPGFVTYTPGLENQYRKDLGVKPR